MIVGVLPLTGLSDGDSVTARRNQPIYNSRAGNDGAVGRAKVTDKRGQVEIHIMQTSEMNDLLSATFNLDSLSEEGSFFLPSQILRCYFCIKLYRSIPFVLAIPLIKVLVDHYIPSHSNRKFFCYLAFNFY